MKGKNTRAAQKQPPAKKDIKKIAKPEKQKYYLALFIILLISFLAYLPVLKNGFVSWDDDKYIYNNPDLLHLNLKQIFSGFNVGNYHPLTMLVYTIEYQYFGVNAEGYHGISLLLHLLNTALVFYVILSLSSKTEVALVASLLFGIHPLHVESVAWASELKDLLYTFFFLGSYIFYLHYIKGYKMKFYLFCLLLFLLSLFSKAMAASLPPLLLLTDYFKGRKINEKVMLEKIPFFALSLVFGIVAIYAQKSSAAIHDSAFYPLLQRIAFASYGFITYLLQLFLPVNLSAIYPYPLHGSTFPSSYYIYPFLFLAFCFAVFYSLRFSRKIIFGTGFFMVTVFLVLQLLPVGDAIMADRYSYIPSIGIFYLAGEGFYWLWNKKTSTGNLRLPTALFLIAIVVFFSFQTNARSKTWKNGMSFWDDVISKYETIPMAYNNRGAMLADEKKYDEALSDYTKTISLDHDYANVYTNRANLFRDKNEFEKSLADYDKSIELQPNDAETYNNRGILFMNQKRFEDALTDYNKALAIEPRFAKAYNDLALLSIMENKYKEALDYCEKAIDIMPNFGEAFYNRARAKYYVEGKEAACEDLEKAVKLKYLPALDTYNQICR